MTVVAIQFTKTILGFYCSIFTFGLMALSAQDLKITSPLKV